MLEHQKKVLQGVSYDKSLFRKELVKSIAWLNVFELSELRKWLNNSFWQTHADVITEVMYPNYEVA
ncbi:MAG: hypothetical protein MI922_22610 [Bacteroidales bacterium]|nr:hypothetical protein [Bacteroidales bacterium]